MRIEIELHLVGPSSLLPETIRHAGAYARRQTHLSHMLATKHLDPNIAIFPVED